MENTMLFDIDVDASDDSDNENDGTSSIDKEKLARQKKLFLKGLVPAVDHAMAQNSYCEMKESASNNCLCHSKAILAICQPSVQSIRHNRNIKVAQTNLQTAKH
eukprot:7529655-Ditylum_brightwellii.AAC.1